MVDAFDAKQVVLTPAMLHTTARDDEVIEYVTSLIESSFLLQSLSHCIKRQAAAYSSTKLSPHSGKSGNQIYFPINTPKHPKGNNKGIVSDKSFTSCTVNINSSKKRGES